MRTKKSSLSLEIRAPGFIELYYDFLQEKLDEILSDEALMDQILSVNHNQHKGRIWLEYNKVLKSETSSWGLKNRAWFARMVFENIRRVASSKFEAQVIFDLVKEIGITPELFESLSKQGIFATRSQVENLLRSKTRPKVPKSAVFVMDYSVSDQQMFTMDEDLLCRFKIGDKWNDYQIILPGSLNPQLTGKVSKPRFVKKDGHFKGFCTYEIEILQSSGKAVLGVDLGKVKPFSAVSLLDGKYDFERICSKQVDHLNEKLDRLYTAKRSLIDKIDRIEALGVVPRPSLVLELKRVSGKAERLKREIAEKVALEIALIAKQEECGVIHLENLSWLGSRGGKWNHSFIQEKIEKQAVKSGVSVVKVSARNSSTENPETGEIGKKVGRSIVFEDGTLIDRDFLGGINLASRVKKGKSKKTVLRKGRPTPKRPPKRVQKNTRTPKQKAKGGVKIVTFSLGVDLKPKKVSLVLSSEVIAKSSLLC